MVIDSSQDRSGQGWLFPAALATLMLLLAGTLLYPDTLATAGLRIGQARLSPLGGLMALAAVPVAAYVWQSRRSLDFQLLDVLLLAGLAFITVRGAWAASNTNGLLLVIAYGVYALLGYYGIATVGQKDTAMRVILWTMAILAVIIAAYALVEFVVGRNILFDGLTADKLTFRTDSLHRTGSTLGHPVYLGIVMVQLVPFLVYFFVKTKDIRSRVWWGVAIVLALMALWVSYSKGSIGAALALVAVAAVWIDWKKAAEYKKTFIILLVTGLICILTLGIIFYKNANYNLFSVERREDSFDLRWFFWEKAPGAIADHPIIGSGLWQGVSIFEVVDQHAVDNLYLSTLVEEGLLGTLLFGGALVLIGRQTWRLISNGGQQRMLALALAASMAGLLLAGLTSSPLFIWPTAVLFWVVAGLVRAVHENKARQRLANA